MERPRVNCPRLERDLIILSEDTSRHGHHFAQQRPGFFEALEMNKGVRVVIGFSDRVIMLFVGSGAVNSFAQLA